MARYFAFLRAINVGGSNVIKMEELRRTLASAGFPDARTYLQSGNVIFEAQAPGAKAGRATAGAAKPGDARAFEARIEAALLSKKRMRVSVMVRSQAELLRVVHEVPQGRTPPRASRVFVTFLKEAPKAPPPARTAKGDVVFLSSLPREVYSVGLEVKGHFGNPNAALEKALGVPATTRYLSVVEELARDAGGGA